MKLLGFLTLALAAVAGAQTPLAPLWTRPAFNVISGLDYNSATLRVVALTSNTMTVFPKGSTVPVWHVRTEGEAVAQFSGDGSVIVLSGPGKRVKLYNAATGAFLRYLSSSTAVQGQALYVPSNSPYAVGGGNLLVEGHGVYRSSDGAAIAISPATTSTPPESLDLDPTSHFSPDGQKILTGATITDLRPNASPVTASESFFLDTTADSATIVGSNSNNDRLEVVRLSDMHTTLEVSYPAGFFPLRIHRLGNVNKFVLLGYELVDNEYVHSAITIDISTGRILDHYVSPFRYTYGASILAFVTEGSNGIAFGANAPNPMDRDRLVQVPFTSSNFGTPIIQAENPRSQEFLSGGLLGAGALATGSQTSSAKIDLLNGETGLISHQVARHPIANGSFDPFVISPSGKYLFFNGQNDTDFTVRMTAALVGSGNVANESADYGAYSLLPLADDTILGYVNTPDGVVNARITRSGTGFSTYRIYTEAAGNPILAASADGKTYLIADYSRLRLFDVSTGQQIAYSSWDSVVLRAEDVQAVVEGDGFVVVAKRVIDEDAKRIYLDVRRYARQGAALVPLSNAVRRSYILRKNVSGVDTRFELHFKLSPDGRAVWANYQRADGTEKSDWLGEWIRTADGAVLNQVNDPTFDFGATATAIDPLNRRSYLSRQEGSVQGVPVANALASILADTPEVAGGMASGATFRLLRPTDASRSYTASATGVTLDQTNVDFAAGVRDVHIGFSTPAVDVATDATIKVADALGNVSTKVHLVPARLIAASIAPDSIVGGNPVTLTLSLDGQAGSQGRLIGLTDNNSALLTPVSATVDPGSASVLVTIPTKRVSKAVTVTLTARLDGKAVTAKVRLDP